MALRTGGVSMIMKSNCGSSWSSSSPKRAEPSSSEGLGGIGPAGETEAIGRRPVRVAPFVAPEGDGARATKEGPVLPRRTGPPGLAFYGWRQTANGSLAT